MDELLHSHGLQKSMITIVGRVVSPSGCISDRVLKGTAALRLPSCLETQRLIQLPCDLAKEFTLGDERPLAIVGISFGPTPSSDFDKLFWKGDFDEAKHPRVPGGCPQGGEFCSADNPNSATDTIDSTNNQNAVTRDLMSKVDKRIARRALRNRFIAALRAIVGTAADAVPFVGEIFDSVEIGQTISDGVALQEDVAAAKAFVQEGPKALESLQMSSDYKPFPSFNAFRKEIFGKYFGPAGDGYEYHHIVEQGGKGLGNLPAGLMDSTENIVKIPRLLHEEISAEYGKEYEETGMTLREWLSKQPYDVRRAKGIEIMRKLGIIK